MPVTYAELAEYLSYLEQDPPTPPEFLIEALKEYLGAAAGDLGEDQLLSVLAVEQALQAAACRVPAFGDNSVQAQLARTALVEALFRRVAVNLAPGAAARDAVLRRRRSADLDQRPRGPPDRGAVPQGARRMSAAEVRTQLAAAANTVDGVKCTPTYTQLSRVGQACVRRDRIDYPNAFGGVASWNVVVCLGQDMGRAEAFFDDTVPALVEALGEVMQVKSAAPQQLKLVDGTTVLAAFITGLREEE